MVGNLMWPVGTEFDSMRIWIWLPVFLQRSGIFVGKVACVGHWLQYYYD